MTKKEVDVGRRFGGIIRLYGKKKFQWIQNSHICVIGIGGVGSWVAESLARHGVGKITLIDMDHIVESNINRQIHALDSTNGESKIKAMKDRIMDINPQCQVECIDDFFHLLHPCLNMMMIAKQPGKSDALLNQRHLIAICIKTEAFCCVFEKLMTICEVNRSHCFNGDPALNCFVSIS